MKAYKPQSFDHLTGLDGISDGQVKEHLELYQGYVKQVNTLSEKLEEMLGHGKVSGTDPYFAELTRHLGFEYNGMILHEYYFSNLKRAADPSPPKGSGLAQALFAEALAFAQAGGFGEMMLWSDSRFARGHRFYEKLGFRRWPGERYLADISATWEYHFRMPLPGPAP